MAVDSNWKVDTALVRTCYSVAQADLLGTDYYYEIPAYECRDCGTQFACEILADGMLDPKHTWDGIMRCPVCGRK